MALSAGLAFDVASRDKQRADAIAHWLGEEEGEAVQFEQVEAGDEQFLPPRE